VLEGRRSAERQREKEGSWFYEMTELGWNYRITDIQCALGASQLRKLPAWLERRREIAALYGEAFAPCRRLEPLSVRRDAEHAYHLYVVRLKIIPAGMNRAAVFSELRRRGVEVNMHTTPGSRERFGTRRGDCPAAEAAYESILSLPVFPSMRSEDVPKVVDALREILKED